MTSTHPCDRRKALAPWKPDHVYIGDTGEILCGRCMGIESTYTPWAWSDLGKMGPDRSVTRPPEPIEMGRGNLVHVESMAYRCETDRYAHGSTH